jgi:hypothetical protein
MVRAACLELPIGRIGKPFGKRPGFNARSSVSHLKMVLDWPRVRRVVPIRKPTNSAINPGAYHLNLHFSGGDAPKLTKILIQRGGRPFKTVSLKEIAPSAAFAGADLERLEFEWQAGTQGFVLALLAYKTQLGQDQPSFFYHEPPLSSACGVVGSEANWLRRALGDDVLKIFKVKRGKVGGVSNRTIGLEIHTALLPVDEIDIIQGEAKEKEIKGPALAELERMIRSQWDTVSIAAKRLAEGEAHQREKSEAAEKAATMADERRRQAEERRDLEAAFNRVQAETQQLALERAKICEDTRANAEENLRLTNEAVRLDTEKMAFEARVRNHRRWMGLAAAAVCLAVGACVFVPRLPAGSGNKGGKAASLAGGGDFPDYGSWNQADKAQLYDVVRWAIQDAHSSKLDLSTNVTTFLVEMPRGATSNSDSKLWLWKYSGTSRPEHMTFGLMRNGTNHALVFIHDGDLNAPGIDQGSFDED